MKRHPSTSEPSWPQERNLARYNELTGIHIQSHLKNGGLWIDVGVGKGAKPMSTFLKKRRTILKAISPHIHALPPGIELTTGSVPEHVEFLKQNRGRALLVTDVFGAISYSADPVQALIYEALLLHAGGVCVCFTELHRLGGLMNWDRVTRFFHEQLGQKIVFQTEFVFGDASKQFSTYLRICIEGKSASRAALPKIFREARRLIGIPKRGEPLWIAADKSAEIYRVDYLCDP